MNSSGSIDTGAPGFVFSFETSGPEGGDSSWLDITIDSNCGFMEIATDGAPRPKGCGTGRKVALRFMGDIELSAVAKGLEFLAREVRRVMDRPPPHGKRDTMTKKPDYERLPGEVELWRNRQWAVTTKGLNALYPQDYWIKAEDLRGSLPAHSWVEQLAEKEWCDLEEFIGAYLVACSLHGVRATQEELRAAIERARTSREEADVFNAIAKTIAPPGASIYRGHSPSEGEAIGRLAVAEVARRRAENRK